MIERPTLVIMAAGMGSRYGGLKQIDPMTDEGEIILDFSLYDAMLAGFQDVVLIIKKETEADFRALIDERAGRHMNIHYAFQDVADLPEGFSVPEGRVKPWGTGHAVLSARDLVAGPFAVINADDYYGSGAFQAMYDFLEAAEDGEKFQYAMVGYLLEQTLSESGTVARGICDVSEDGKLLGITERTKIKRLEDSGAIAFTEDDGETWSELPEGTPVSMNFWGFTNSFMAQLAAKFPDFLAKSAICDAAKLTLHPTAEYFLPGVVDELIKEGRAEVSVLRSSDRWYGVTNKEDKPLVASAIRSMKDKGLYPKKLWM